MIQVNQSLRDYIYQQIENIANNPKDLDNFYRLLKETYNKNEEDEEAYIRVSQIVNCPRKEYFRLKLKEKEPKNAKSFLTLELGSSLHKIIQCALQNIVVSKEQKIIINDKLSGHYDGIINFENQLSLIEIKTASPFALDNLLKEVYKVETDYQALNSNMLLYKYLLQSNCYIKMLQDSRINSGWIILGNKASVKGIDPIFTIKFLYDEKLANIMLNRANDIFDYIMLDKLPPKTDSTYLCNKIYCGYADMCGKLDNDNTRTS